MEGQLDAIAVDGCAISHNEPSDTQIMRLNALGREVIVVPDRDKPGAKMIQTAIEQGWTVSMPDWGDNIKDAADAVKKFGRVYTLFTILHYKETNEIKKQLLKKKLELL
jgi:DNA primase